MQRSASVRARWADSYASRSIASARRSVLRSRHAPPPRSRGPIVNLRPDWERCSLLSVFGEARLDRGDLLVHLVVGAGPVVDLHDDAHARRFAADRFDTPLQHRHHVVPFALDVREHRVGLIGEAAFAHDTDGVGNGATDRLADTERRDRERTQHRYSSPAERRTTFPMAEKSSRP